MEQARPAAYIQKPQLGPFPRALAIEDAKDGVGLMAHEKIVFLGKSAEGLFDFVGIGLGVGVEEPSVRILLCLVVAQGTYAESWPNAQNLWAMKLQLT